MVQLAQAEIIQIYRRRSGINQGDFGSRAFNTSYESGRTKMKNIELGRKIPTPTDLKNIAAVLDVSVSDLIPRRLPAAGEAQKMAASRTFFSQAVLNRFPGLDAYVDMLNKAVRVDDSELLAYLCSRIASLLNGGCKRSRQAAR